MTSPTTKRVAGEGGPAAEPETPYTLHATHPRIMAARIHLRSRDMGRPGDYALWWSSGIAYWSDRRGTKVPICRQMGDRISRRAVEREPPIVVRCDSPFSAASPAGHPGR